MNGTAIRQLHITTPVKQHRNLDPYLLKRYTKFNVERLSCCAQLKKKKISARCIILKKLPELR